MNEPNLRQRVLDQIHHRETQPLPYRLGIEEGVSARLDAHYGTDAWRGLIQNAISGVGLPGTVVDQSAEGEYTTDFYGSRWQINRRPFHLVAPALAEPTLAGYRFPDLDTLFGPDWRARMTQDITREREAGRFVTAGFGFGLFERTWTLRGFNEILMDAAGDPAFYDALVEQVAQHQMAILERLLELPVDGIMFSDDWGYQREVLLGPERWRRFIKPRLARMYALVHAADKYTLSHCCGSVRSIMPDIIEIGLDVLESVQPEAEGMNPYDLKREYGHEITFWGGLGSQSTIPFGTPAEIEAEVAHLCSAMGQGGGYILGPAKALQPETPTANAAAVVEAFLAQAGVSFP